MEKQAVFSGFTDSRMKVSMIQKTEQILNTA